eukprot:4123602-Prymnesium_polylepis.1
MHPSAPPLGRALASASGWMSVKRVVRTGEQGPLHVLHGAPPPPPPPASTDSMRPGATQPMRRDQFAGGGLRVKAATPERRDGTTAARVPHGGPAAASASG